MASVMAKEGGTWCEECECEWVKGDWSMVMA